jgi:hypothetical protein
MFPEGGRIDDWRPQLDLKDRWPGKWFNSFRLENSAGAAALLTTN